MGDNVTTPTVHLEKKWQLAYKYNIVRKNLRNNCTPKRLVKNYISIHSDHQIFCVNSFKVGETKDER